MAIEKNVNTIPKIDLDNFDKDAFFAALRDYGSFELVGSAIDELAPLRKQMLETTKKLLELRHHNPEKLADLPFDLLKFIGFQDIAKTTAASVKAGKATEIRSQVAFHFKPHFDQILPEGIDRKIYEEYYLKTATILRTLYKKIAEEFIDPNRRSNFDDNKKSVLTTREYFPQPEEVSPTAENKSTPSPTHTVTGIPPHSDYGLLTLVTSDKPGLEIEKDGTWIPADSDPEPRFYINGGDWLRYQMNHPELKAGVHRVPETKETRYSLATFLNPKAEELLQLPNGRIATYQEYLVSPKTPYLPEAKAPITPRANPTPLPLSQKIPSLYVKESSENKPAWMVVKGAGQSIPLPEKGNKELHKKIFENFSYASTTSELTTSLNKLLPQSEENSRLYEITLKYANDAYVIDEAAGNSHEWGEDAKNAIANTLIPLQEYKGDYKKPAYLIQRPLEKDEAKEITTEKSFGIAV